MNYLPELHRQSILGMDKANIIKTGTAKIFAPLSSVSATKYAVLWEK